jgi:hypothetical protein
MKRPSAALVIASLALFVSLGGTSIAATHYLITSTKQIRPSVLKKLQKAGPRGAVGATGAAGATGTFGPSNVTIVNGPTVAFGEDNPEVAGVGSTASCPAGDTVIGGGFRSVDGVVMTGSVSDDGASGTAAWTVYVHDDQNGSGGDFYAQAVCASPAGS